MISANQHPVTSHASLSPRSRRRYPFTWMCAWHYVTFYIRKTYALYMIYYVNALMYKSEVEMRRVFVEREKHPTTWHHYYFFWLPHFLHFFFFVITIIIIIFFVFHIFIYTIISFSSLSSSAHMMPLFQLILPFHSLVYCFTITIAVFHMPLYYATYFIIFILSLLSSSFFIVFIFHAGAMPYYVLLRNQRERSISCRRRWHMFDETLGCYGYVCWR